MLGTLSQQSFGGRTMNSEKVIIYLPGRWASDSLVEAVPQVTTKNEYSFEGFVNLSHGHTAWRSGSAVAHIRGHLMRYGSC